MTSIPINFVVDNKDYSVNQGAVLAWENSGHLNMEKLLSERKFIINEDIPIKTQWFKS